MKFTLTRVFWWLPVVAASGAAALVYQVVWQRWLALTTGATATSSAIVVAAFLAGLGIGAVVGGYLADRVSGRRAFLVFGGLEVGIALAGLGSAAVLYRWLPTVGGLGPETAGLTFVVLMLVLLPPTLLMGMTLPVLATAVRLSTPLAQAGFIGRLVAVNTLGAAAGAVAAILLLVPAVGFEGAVVAAAVVNLACAGGALVWWWRGTGPAVQEERPVPAHAAPQRWSPGWMLHAWVAGAAGIAYELAALRILDVMVKSRAQTFAVMLGAYLVGFAVGSWAGDRWLTRWSPRRWSVFLGSQVLLYALMAALPALVLAVAEGTGWAAPWFNSFASYRPVQTPLVMGLNYLAVPFVLLTIPAALMGFGFSLSQQLLHDEHAGLGRRLGWYLGANALGCVAGAIGASLWAFPVLGTPTTLRVLAAIGLGYTLVWIMRPGPRGVRVLAGAMVGVSLWLLPGTSTFWRVLSGVSDPALISVVEERDGVSSLRFSRNVGVAALFAGGNGQSRLPRAVDLPHVFMGALPVFVHDAPRRVGVVGLGAGGTLWGAAARPDVEALICWELLTGQQTLLHDYAARTGDTEATFFERDARIVIRHADGRHALQRSSDLFDVLIVDAVLPEAGGAGLLYSREFFEVLRSRLAPGGIAATWAPTRRSLRTMHAAFPHVTEVGDRFVLGTEQPLPLDWPVVTERLRILEARDHLGPFAEELIEWMQFTITEGTGVRDDVNTDMHPRDELDGLWDLVTRFLRRRQPA